jgi:diguanylate cyclase (GGDEF)-like protein
MWLDTMKSIHDLDSKNEELEKLALRDQLTGLANRHYFDYDIEFLVATSKRNESHMGMLLIDLDRFKLVNDIHGHDVGDAVLKQTAEIITHSLRASDRAYRWGGEEFLVVLPDTD